MDEFVSDLLTKDSVCDTILPRISKRQVVNIRLGFGGAECVGAKNQSFGGGFTEGVARGCLRRGGSGRGEECGGWGDKGGYKGGEEGKEGKKT